MIGIIMFFCALVMLLIGFPVAFTFAAVSVLFGLIAGIAEIGFDAGLIAGLTEGLVEGAAMFDYIPGYSRSPGQQWPSYPVHYQTNLCKELPFSGA